MMKAWHNNIFWGVIMPRAKKVGLEVLCWRKLSVPLKLLFVHLLFEVCLTFSWMVPPIVARGFQQRNNQLLVLLCLQKFSLSLACHFVCDCSLERETIIHRSCSNQVFLNVPQMVPLFPKNCSFSTQTVPNPSHTSWAVDSIIWLVFPEIVNCCVVCVSQRKQSRYGK